MCNYNLIPCASHSPQTVLKQTLILNVNCASSRKATKLCMPSSRKVNLHGDLHCVAKQTRKFLCKYTKVTEKD